MFHPSLGQSDCHITRPLITVPVASITSGATMVCVLGRYGWPDIEGLGAREKTGPVLGAKSRFAWTRDVSALRRGGFTSSTSMLDDE
jgi:hypothetical protein